EQKSGGSFGNSDYNSQNRLNLARICFLSISDSWTVISTFAFIFSETTFVFLYTRRPKSSLKRLSKINMQTWQFPALAASFSFCNILRAPSAFFCSICLWKSKYFPEVESLSNFIH